MHELCSETNKNYISIKTFPQGTTFSCENRLKHLSKTFVLWSSVFSFATFFRSLLVLSLSFLHSSLAVCQVFFLNIQRNYI